MAPELPDFLDGASREFLLTGDAAGRCTWADGRARKVLGIEAGAALQALAPAGTEEKLARLLRQAGTGEVRSWEVSLLVRGVPATVLLHAAPHAGGIAVLGSLLPEEHAVVLAQVSDAMNEVVGLNRQLARQQKELALRHAEVLRLNADLEDSFRAVKVMHAELEDRAEALRLSVDVRGRVVANVSHEFRTPLHAILGLSQLLLDQIDGVLNAEQRKQVGFIRTGAEQLSQMVGDLLDLSKLEAGKVSIRVERFPARELFGALRGMLAPLLPRDGAVRLVFDDPPEDLELETDRAKTSQVMRNLISNALKFTERGEVRVGIALDGKGGTRLSVKDTGAGIAPEDHLRIFEEFEQAGGAESRAAGTGLGLPISRKLATLLGGTLTLESEEGKGATFTLWLPGVHPDVEEMNQLAARSQVLDPARQPVLVVEDDRKAMFGYARDLHLGGFQLIPASTIDEARGALKRVRPAAILLDIMLERESTWGFLAELKQDPASADIPVLVVTVSSRSQQARALGADDFWLKPVDSDRLLQKLQAVAASGVIPRVLVIDDDDAARYVLRKHLESEPFRLFEASTGPDGARLASQHLPHVIVLDFLLRDHTAFDVLDALRSNPRTRGIPVIISTSQALDDDQVTRLSAMTDSIVSKQQFLSRDLAINRIRDALAKASLDRPKSLE